MHETAQGLYHSLENQRWSFLDRGLNQYPDGFAAEFIIVPSVLSTSDRQKMEGYLAHK